MFERKPLQENICLRRISSSIAMYPRVSNRILQVTLQIALDSWKDLAINGSPQGSPYPWKISYNRWNWQQYIPKVWERPFLLYHTVEACSHQIGLSHSTLCLLYGLSGAWMPTVSVLQCRIEMSRSIWVPRAKFL